ALITTFAPPQRANSISVSSITSKRSYTSDVFSLTTVLLTILSMILQHTPKSFASHRCRLNRQAGRGNAPPDSSFHKNLNQVTKWIDMLAKEAGQREKKDMKFWGAVNEIAQVCRLGIRKEAKERISARDLEKKVGGWIQWGLGRRRKCSCMNAGDPDQDDIIDGQEVEEPTSKYSLGKNQPPPKPFTVTDRRPPTSKQEHSGKRSMSEPVNSVDLSSTRPMSRSSMKDSTVWGLGDLSHLHSGMMRPASIASDRESTVWGLADQPPAPAPAKPPPPPRPQTSGGESIIWGLQEVRSSDNQFSDMRAGKMHFPLPKGYADSHPESVTTSCIAVGVPGGESVYGSDGESEETEDGGRVEDWPLPLGSLTLDQRDSTH
ncbi:hypothetical protein P7C71_g5273, partial [Lecanoromycetidae sp. Uapishka_2]